ncbi:hypothetical protein GCM10011374_30560 [Kocuria dechangensis]|uniref:Uncharacterized protein n=1 Tax=Kocuria dechangensis TaxID=1176249 RepID=A0A917H2K5_9MICC|nr:hypothetical protein [Kocuria dechangensis]GGG64772.1 hypothetical protein GCM10011374_30560 [Kocuria dechangensis]
MPLDTMHRWANQGTGPVRFLAEIAPGHEGFEKGQQILYGLASDGMLEHRWEHGKPVARHRGTFEEAMFWFHRTICTVEDDDPDTM